MMRVLVVNTGSSSLKLAVVAESGTIVRSTLVERWDGDEVAEPLAELLSATGAVDAVGHRVVHGGDRHRRSVRLDDAVIAELAEISDMAPLHNPRALAGIRAVALLLPDTPAVAAFDTAYFAAMPLAASTYGLPRAWNERFALKRYGFHGLSHIHAVRRGAELAGRQGHRLRVVSCHLGAGCSLAASRGGVAVDTTMGFTPLAGLVMQTRSGSVDPGLLIWLQTRGGIDVESLSDALEHHAGLRGLSGTSGDMRDVLAGVRAGDPSCQLAFDVFVHRIAREVGAMAASAGGLDLLVFTGGVGEHVPEVRDAVASRLEHLGVGLDPEANRTARSDADISRRGAEASTVVVTAGEEVQVAAETRRTLGRDSAPPGEDPG